MERRAGAPQTANRGPCSGCGTTPPPNLSGLSIHRPGFARKSRKIHNRHPATPKTGIVSHFQRFVQARNRMPIPRGTTVSNRLGRSSDWLPFRSLPDPGGSVAEILGTSAEFHSSGTVRDLHPIPFSFPSPHGELETKSVAKITLNPRKTNPQVGKYHPIGLPEPWRSV